LVSRIVAGTFAFGAQFLWGQLLSVLPRLTIAIAILLGVYVAILFYVTGQKSVYLNLFRDIRGSSSVEEKTLVPV